LITEGLSVSRLHYSLRGLMLRVSSAPMTPPGVPNKLKGREREKGIAMKMRVKLAAKLLVIAWTLMKKKEKFDPGCIV